ncbi:hypothetical protein LguiA_033851 [Lonicera macranthoides]
MESTKLYVLVCFVILLATQGSAVDITYLESGKAKGAVCLDGSAPAYQFDKGVGEGANNWLVHLEGGAWCTSPESCYNRTHIRSGLGSSKLMKKRPFTGILSNKKLNNINFYNWNRILVRYCDGASFTGDVEKMHPALLSGSSAGGLASILHCDKFRAMLPTSIKVKCLSDAGYFVHVKDVSGGYHFQETYFDKVVKTHGSSKNLPRSCTSKMNHGLCFYPQFVAPQIRTPLFIINSFYDLFQITNILAPTEIGPNGSWAKCQFELNKCSPHQIEILKEFRLHFLQAIFAGLRNSSSRGMFINACHTHCQSEFPRKWLGDPDTKLGNKAIEEAVADWFYDRNSVQLIDFKHNLPQQCVLNPDEPNSKNNYTWGAVGGAIGSATLGAKNVVYLCSALNSAKCFHDAYDGGVIHDVYDGGGDGVGVEED